MTNGHSDSLVQKIARALKITLFRVTPSTASAIVPRVSTASNARTRAAQMDQQTLV